MLHDCVNCSRANLKYYFKMRFGEEIRATGITVVRGGLALINFGSLGVHAALWDIKDWPVLRTRMQKCC